MQLLFFMAIGVAIIFVVGIVIGASLEKKRKTVGTIVIDQTGEKDRWTVIFDEDLGDVENETIVALKIQKKT